MSEHYVRAYKKEWSRGSGSREDVGYCEGFYVRLYCDLVGGSKAIAWFSDKIDAIAYGQMKAYTLGINFHQDIPGEEPKKKKRGKK